MKTSIKMTTGNIRHLNVAAPEALPPDVVEPERPKVELPEIHPEAPPDIVPLPEPEADPMRDGPPDVTIFGFTLPLMSATSWKLYTKARRWLRRLLRRNK